MDVISYVQYIRNHTGLSKLRKTCFVLLKAMFGVQNDTIPSLW